MTTVLDWKRSDDVRDIVHLSVQSLAEGHLIALPTCTSYVAVANANHPSAVASLKRLSSSQSSISNGAANKASLPPIALMMRSSSEVHDYSPRACPTALRLVRRSWPGPTHFLLPAGHPDSLLNQLPSHATSTITSDDGTVRVCRPAHQAVQEIARLSASPLLVLPLNNSVDATPSVLASSVNSIDNLSIVIDGGLTKYQGQATIAKVADNNCEVMHGGVTSKLDLQTQSRLLVMLVCTGNTCRSPMAEKLLESKIQSAFVGKAEDSYVPVVVISAGISAGGGPASPQAVAAMSERGLSLDEHQSCAVSEKEIDSADLILTMTRNHLQVIISRWPQSSKRAHLLSPEGIDVSDPFGGPVAVYREVAKQIDEYLDSWVEKLLLMPLAKWR
jgi:protein-tyrosine-phosphatase/tRNA A37 threonylcarbamoyladenosine synthetase subunit TsaC/SUA5/YrdC